MIFLELKINISMYLFHLHCSNVPKIIGNTTDRL